MFGQSATLTATVAITGNGAGTPTGTVLFFDGCTYLGLAVVVLLSLNIGISIACYLCFTFLFCFKIFPRTPTTAVFHYLTLS